MPLSLCHAKQGKKGELNRVRIIRLQGMENIEKIREKKGDGDFYL